MYFEYLAYLETDWHNKLKTKRRKLSGSKFRKSVVFKKYVALCSSRYAKLPSPVFKKTDKFRIMKQEPLDRHIHTFRDRKDKSQNPYSLKFGVLVEDIFLRS